MTYLRGWGVPGCVTKCDRGRRSKLAKNSVTYFMDGPKDRQPETGRQTKAEAKNTLRVDRWTES